MGHLITKTRPCSGPSNIDVPVRDRSLPINQEAIIKEFLACF
jgi:hypothetical protein